MYIHALNILTLIYVYRSREICVRNFHWKKRKWTNKWNDQQEEVDFLKYNTSFSMFVPNRDGQCIKLMPMHW